MSDEQQDPKSTPWIRIGREIPLPYLLAGVFAFCTQAVVLYYNQQTQERILIQQAAEIKVLGTKLDQIIDRRTEETVKDIQRDNRLDRQGERIDALEKAAQRNNGR